MLTREKSPPRQNLDSTYPGKVSSQTESRQYLPGKSLLPDRISTVLTREKSPPRQNLDSTYPGKVSSQTESRQYLPGKSLLPDRISTVLTREKSPPWQNLDSTYSGKVSSQTESRQYLPVRFFFWGFWGCWHPCLKIFDQNFKIVWNAKLSTFYKNWGGGGGGNVYLRVNGWSRHV